MINTKTNQLVADLANRINAAQLPPCVVGLVLDKLRWQVAQLEAQAVQAEAQKAGANAEEAQPSE